MWHLRFQEDGWAIFEDHEFIETRELSFLSRKARIPYSFSSMAELNDWLFSEEKKQAKNVIIRYLAMRNYPSQLLRKKLVEKGFSNSSSELAITWAIENGYVQDQEYLHRQILQEIAKGNGPKAIVWKLRTKEFDVRLIEARVRELYPIEKQIESIKKNLSRLSKDPQKRIQVFFRRGFSLDVIRSALRE
jgi:SOS response regulatory protein OraA/RecX